MVGRPYRYGQVSAWFEVKSLFSVLKTGWFHKTVRGLLAVVLLGVAAAGSAQTVSNVAYKLNEKELTVTYSLDAPAAIRLRVVSHIGGQIYVTDPIQNLSGDVGPNVQPGETKSIQAFDMPEIRGLDTTEFHFIVEVDDGSVNIYLNDIVLKMLPVEGGTYMMGHGKNDGTRYHCESAEPAHRVTVSDFYLGQFEVTQKLWNAVMDANPSKWQDNDSLPVESVSWNDVQVFVARLSQVTGYRFRLPTEAEWEYAARGGKKSKGYAYPGTTLGLADYAWLGSNSGNRTHPVGRKLPNELGFYDMGGNVWEWCSDWAAPYTPDEQHNPQGPTTGENKIARGGCMISPSWGCAVSDRCWYLPDHGYGFYGFRLALDSVEREQDDGDDVY